MSHLKKAGPWVLPAVLTAIAIVWAVAAIGDILTAQAHPAFAYSVAVLYDAVWLYALAQETAHRRQGSSARLPKVMGWVFLPLTVAILVVHGLLAADLLAAAVGGLVPVLAKVTLVMAIDRDTTRISPRAQAAIDRTRAATRDKIAVSRALAAARADETRAAADIVKRSRKAEAEATTTVHQALEAHAEIIDQHPVPDWHTDLPALVSDHELDALLAGGVPGDETAGGTGGFALTETPVTVTPCQSGTPSLEGAQNANLRAVALLAAELYATTPPPSKRKFREAMREAMRARGLTGGWDVVDALYDREKALAEGGERS
ncbi:MULTISPECIES: hypothetical protein [Streptomyces]|uniref:Uncharacterized protein n=1 Tax=Streptomyces bottropensis TaxID=42235 RepID=A0ABU8AQ54_9ACTN|nr:hypothetical protein [Streptomyces scabiei]MDX2538604.1 hypothetical protein [Streptomyces scabiei]MDX2799878.1 hypothetical protein [Streptomyces scabiei]MDX2858161.1 hypothetical protein [Streptomyces scabiei]MDX3277856.1 hypothetical protein [Streptomyces scabiei]MDX3828533.1 hypothetical protein [Streptomyces scabiei]